MSCYAQVADVLPGRQMRRMLLVGLQCLKAFELYQHYVACIIDRAEVEANLYCQQTRNLPSQRLKRFFQCAHVGTMRGAAALTAHIPHNDMANYHGSTIK